MPKRKPRMTVAFVAKQLAAEYPDVYAEFTDFMRTKRLIGLVNAAMSEGHLDWFLHRGQRRIGPEALDAFVSAQAERLEQLAAASREVCARPEQAKSIAERYPLSQPGPGKKRKPRRAPKPDAADMGPSLGEIE